MSKGSHRRPDESKSFDSNYESIFGSKKISRGSFVWDSELGKLVDKSSYKNDSHMVMDDIQPYKSMITGEMITSRSQHRDHLKQHGCIEVGNETPKTMSFEPSKQEVWARKNLIWNVMHGNVHKDRLRDL